MFKKYFFFKVQGLQGPRCSSSLTKGFWYLGYLFLTSKGSISWKKTPQLDVFDAWVRRSRVIEVSGSFPDLEPQPDPRKRVPRRPRQPNPGCEKPTHAPAGALARDRQGETVISQSSTPPPPARIPPSGSPEGLDRRTPDAKSQRTPSQAHADVRRGAVRGSKKRLSPVDLDYLKCKGRESLILSHVSQGAFPHFQIS
jgi:hypothetical protein